jgi:hypothetical protein
MDLGARARCKPDLLCRMQQVGYSCQWQIHWVAACTAWLLSSLRLQGNNGDGLKYKQGA